MASTKEYSDDTIQKRMSTSETHGSSRSEKGSAVHTVFRIPIHRIGLSPTIPRLKQSAQKKRGNHPEICRSIPSECVFWLAEKKHTLPEETTMIPGAQSLILSTRPFPLGLSSSTTSLSRTSAPMTD